MKRSSDRPLHRLPSRTAGATDGNGSNGSGAIATNGSRWRGPPLKAATKKAGAAAPAREDGLLLRHAHPAHTAPLREATTATTTTEDNATGHEPTHPQTKQPLTLGLSSETREEDAMKHERNPTKQQLRGVHTGGSQGGSLESFNSGKAMNWRRSPSKRSPLDPVGTMANPVVARSSEGLLGTAGGVGVAIVVALKTFSLRRQRPGIPPQPHSGAALAGVGSASPQRTTVCLPRTGQDCAQLSGPTAGRTSAIRGKLGG